MEKATESFTNTRVVARSHLKKKKKKKTHACAHVKLNAWVHVQSSSRAFMRAHVSACACLCFSLQSFAAGLVHIGNHGSLFVPRCSPLAWINALPLSQRSKQAGAAC